MSAAKMEILVKVDAPSEAQVIVMETTSRPKRGHVATGCTCVTCVFRKVLMQAADEIEKKEW